MMVLGRHRSWVDTLCLATSTNRVLSRSPAPLSIDTLPEGPNTQIQSIYPPKPLVKFLIWNP